MRPRHGINSGAALQSRKGKCVEAPRYAGTGPQPNVGQPLAHVDCGLRSYYAQRAAEYERVYAKPERQGDIARLRLLLPELLAGQDVLEVACGTGFWTSVIAQAARTILATDATGEMLDLARAKRYPVGRVRFGRADAYLLENIAGPFTAGFAGFWWSHVPRSRLAAFLRTLHENVGTGGLMVFIDNRYVAGSNHPMTRVDADGNTYQQRTLADGHRFEVLKNFPDADELRTTVAGLADEITITTLTYYWCLHYRIAG
jgi:demethylmenaquinone methyltransferase/2-methoxy-6-polyprenyl-1,4-benzoquinol methylase